MNSEFTTHAPNETAGNAPSGVASEVESLQEQLAAQQSAHLLLVADFENFKRRSRQEMETRAAAQKDAFIQELFPSIDNLERALAVEGSASSPQLRQGVQMTLQQLRQLLFQHGVASEEVVGKAFDPHQHEAIARRREPAQADQTILEVFQRGYRRGAKIHRPAKVVVNDLSPSQ